MACNSQSKKKHQDEAYNQYNPKNYNLFFLLCQPFYPLYACPSSGIKVGRSPDVPFANLQRPSKEAGRVPQV